MDTSTIFSITTPLIYAISFVVVRINMISKLKKNNEWGNTDFNVNSKKFKRILWRYSFLNSVVLILFFLYALSPLYAYNHQAQIIWGLFNSIAMVISFVADDNYNSGTKDSISSYPTKVQKELISAVSYLPAISVAFGLIIVFWAIYGIGYMAFNPVYYNKING